MMLVCDDMSQINQMKSTLRKKWEMSDLGELLYILGIAVHRDGQIVVYI